MTVDFQKLSKNSIDNCIEWHLSEIDPIIILVIMHKVKSKFYLFYYYFYSIKCKLSL